MKERFFRFMRGRYGVDALGRFLIYCGLILALINMLFHNIVIAIISVVIWCFAYFRMFSRDIYRRSNENNRYLSAKASVTGGIRNFWHRIRQKLSNGTINNAQNGSGSYSSRCNSFSGNCYEVQYKVFKCPKCKQKLRVPRGKGKIRIICRRCTHEFIRRT